MRVRSFCPQSSSVQRLLPLPLVLLCLLAWICVLPSVALAGPAIPMCSSYAECVEAPPPEMPPTGGEVRAGNPSDFEFGTYLDQSPERERKPLYSHDGPVDPLSITAADRLLPLANGRTPLRRPTSTSGSLQGIELEIFRPPCAG